MGKKTLKSGEYGYGMVHDTCTELELGDLKVSVWPLHEGALDEMALTFQTADRFFELDVPWQMAMGIRDAIDQKLNLLPDNLRQSVTSGGVPIGRGDKKKSVFERIQDIDEVVQNDAKRLIRAGKTGEQIPRSKEVDAAIKLYKKLWGVK